MENGKFPAWAGPLVGALVGIGVGVGIHRNAPTVDWTICLLGGVGLGLVGGIVMWLVDRRRP